MGTWGNYDCSKSTLPPPPGDNPVINPADYPFTLKLTGDDTYTLFWKLDQAAGTIDLAIKVKTDGWAAFGPGKGQMVGTDPVFSYIDASGQLVINDYMNTAQQTCVGGQGVCTDESLGGTNDIIKSAGISQDGFLNVKWTRKLDTGDSKSDLPITTGQIDVTYAYHPTAKGVSQHPPNTRGTAKIDFFTGATALDNGISLRKAHGSLMFIAWFVIIPFGSYIARYLKKYPWWFNVHRILQGFAMIAADAAFIIALTMVSVHFNTAHKIIGLIVTIIGTSQPIIGIMADKLFDPARKGTPIFPDKTHWVLGWGTLALALVNIGLGLDTYGAVPGLIYAYIAAAALLALGLIIAFIVYLVKGQPSH